MSADCTSLLNIYRGGQKTLYPVVICVKLRYGEIAEHVEISLGIDRSIKEVWTQYKTTYGHPCRVKSNDTLNYTNPFTDFLSAYYSDKHM